MAISKLEVGIVPLGEGGDSLRSAAAKINENFSNTTHAASKLIGTGAEQVPLTKNIPSLLGTAATKNVGTDAEQVPLSKNIPSLLGTAATKDVGTADGQIPLAQDTLKAAFSVSATPVGSASYDCDTFESGTTSYINTAGTLNSPTGFGPQYFIVHTISGYGTQRIQVAYAVVGYTGMYLRTANASTWTNWRLSSTNTITYKTTTALGANVVVDDTGTLMRSTSSERYKDILAPLELDDARYADAMALKPIVYRSTADADNPAYHFYSFSAEELGAYDPAFTLWRETETVNDDEGNSVEQPLAERQAEGININALLAMSHAIAIKQGELIKDLQEQVNALKTKLEV